MGFPVPEPDTRYGETIARAGVAPVTTPALPSSRWIGSRSRATLPRASPRLSSVSVPPCA